jgi:hypothetical protein
VSNSVMYNTTPHTTKGSLEGKGRTKTPTTEL